MKNDIQIFEIIGNIFSVPKVWVPSSIIKRVSFLSLISVTESVSSQRNDTCKLKNKQWWKMYDTNRTHSRRRAKEEGGPTQRKREREKIRNHYSPFRSNWKQNRVDFCSEGAKNSWHGQLFEARAWFIDTLHPCSCYYRRWIFALKIRYGERKATVSKPKIE